MDLSVAGLHKSDPKLKDLPIKKYNTTASAAEVSAVAKALEAVGHKVTVVDTPAAALELLKGALPQNATVSSCGSLTLREIGFLDYLKTRKDVRNFKEESQAAQAANDWAKAGELRTQGLSADYFFTSVSALTHAGDLVSADQTGSRVGGLTATAKNVVIVVGTNKIVKTIPDALKRLSDYCLPLSSAACRILFHADSGITNTVIVSHSNPYGAKGRIHVILVNSTLGY